MATTEHFKDGGGLTFDFSFPILKNSDLKVEIYNATTGVWDLKTENPSGTTNGDYDISNTNVVFNSYTPGGTGNIHIFRTTDVDNPQDFQTWVTGDQISTKQCLSTPCDFSLGEDEGNYVYGSSMYFDGYGWTTGNGTASPNGYILPGGAYVISTLNPGWIKWSV